MRSKSYLDKTINLSKLIIQLREKITLKYHFIAKATSTILKLKKKKNNKQIAYLLTPEQTFLFIKLIMTMRLRGLKCRLLYHTLVAL